MIRLLKLVLSGEHEFRNKICNLYISFVCSCTVLWILFTLQSAFSVSFSELFTIILDMLSVLIHGNLVSENSDKGDESKKPLQQYHQLIRKLKVCHEIDIKKKES